MNKSEVIKILAYIKAAYPNSFIKQTKEDLEVLISLWERQFANHDADIVLQAVESIIATDISDYAPNIAKIKRVYSKIINPDELTEVDAWNCLVNATKNGIYGSVEEFNKLPKIVQRIVGSPDRLRDYAMMSPDELQTFIHNIFRKDYESIQEQEREHEEIAYINNGYKKIGYNKF